MMAAQRQDSGRSVALSWLLEGLVRVPAKLDREITGVTLDSRAVMPGSLFIALPGTRTHGLKFAREALNRGAVAIVHAAENANAPSLRELPTADVAVLAVAELAASAGVIASRFFGDASEALRLIGVTGTDGKTSVSHLLAQVLDSDPSHCGLLGTLGYGRVGDLQPFGLTTPDAVTLQARLAEFASAGLGHAVMEVSSHALVQHRVAGCRFALAVLTNLGRDHLDYHGDLDAYAQAKTRLFATPGLDAAVLNLDDPFSATLLEALPRATRVFGYTRTRAALPGVTTLRAAHLSADANGVEMELAERFAGQRLQAPLLGDFNAMNVLAVATALLALDWRMPRIAAALARCRAIPGRMEKVATALPGNVIVDYAHTPQALQRALSALRPLTAGKLHCVVGCGGDRDRGKRPMMGAIAETHADTVIVTDDNPRSEDPAAIVAEILDGMQQPERALVRQPRELAIRSALQQAKAGDCVLIAGKGHEPWQLVGERRLAFDDRAVVRELAKELSA
jgi:UDP-N-acetylmuramoyl-L-alanyl-D-glutamate--2,6-diaminopimelate ligase